MKQHRSMFRRLMSATLVGIMVLGGLLAGPAPHAHADDQRITLFRAEFDSAPQGPLAGPLPVEVGKVVPQGGSVAVTASSMGPALTLNGSGGQSTALLQWSNFPNGLPISTTEELDLRIVGDFTTSISSTAGASFGLLTGSSFFELFSFGAGGALARGGSPIGLRYLPGGRVHLDVKITLGDGAGKARIALSSPLGKRTITTSLDGTFTLTTLNQLRFQVPSGGGIASADHLRVRLEQDDEDDGPPAVIIIGKGTIIYEIEIINGVIFINVKIIIVNTGGSAHGTFLILDWDDLLQYLDLADVSFLEGVGFVKELNGNHVMIGMGQNNIIDANGRLRLQLKLKLKHNRLDLKFKLNFKLNFNDSGGDHVLVIPPVDVVVGQPVIVTPVVVRRLPLSMIDTRFTAAWERRGGLDLIGLPLTEPITQPDGLVVQYFERARLEFHPELRGTPYEVLQGLLSVELGKRTPPIAPPDAPAERAWYLDQTGHLIAAPFRSFWQSRGGLAAFGMPIGELVEEQGQQVQYFERARLELHPELRGTPYEVQLGHLGVELLQAQGGNSQPSEP